MRISILLLIALILSGCAARENIVYKDVFVPVKCSATMPIKPINDGSFETHKEIMKYYIKCEGIAKICTGESNEKN